MTRHFILRMSLVCKSLLPGIAVSLAACSKSRNPDAGVMSDSTFVTVMAELVRLKNRPEADTVYYAEQRRLALERNKVTLADLEKKGERLAEDPYRSTRIWDKVRQKLGTGG